jgi:type II secretory pathway component PulL
MVLTLSSASRSATARSRRSATSLGQVHGAVAVAKADLDRVESDEVLLVTGSLFLLTLALVFLFSVRQLVARWVAERLVFVFFLLIVVVVGSELGDD